jgi:hypothetical protein
MLELYKFITNMPRSILFIERIINVADNLTCQVIDWAPEEMAREKEFWPVPYYLWPSCYPFSPHCKQHLCF